MIQPLFDKNQIFRNLYQHEMDLKVLVPLYCSDELFLSGKIYMKMHYVAIALGVSEEELIEEYENFKKTVDI